MKDKLDDIDSKFFEKIAKNDEEREFVKARGEAAMKEMPESSAQKGETMVELANGSYELVGSGETHKFQVETGGFMTGGCNGTVQSGKVIFNANGKDYEGNFVSATAIEGAWVVNGAKTKCDFTLSKC